MDQQGVIDQNIQLLEQYRRNLAHALQQRRALRDTYIPAAIFNDIYATRLTIQQLKHDLRDLGVAVADQPDDGWPTDALASCPYPGMRAFKADETLDFFGREKEIEKLLQRL